MASGDKAYLADKATLDEVNTKIDTLGTKLNSTIGTANEKALNDLMTEQYNSMVQNLRLVHEKTSIQTVTIGDNVYGNSNTTQIVGHFTYSGDEEYVYAKITGLVNYGGSSSYGRLLISSDYSASNTYTNVSATCSAEVYTYGDTTATKTMWIKAYKGVTYYVHITSSSSSYSCRVDDCIAEFFKKAENKIEIANTRIAIPSTSYVEIGSFNFNYVPDGVPIKVDLLGELEKNTYNRQGTIAIGTSTSNIITGFNDSDYWINKLFINGTTAILNNKDIYHVYVKKSYSSALNYYNNIRIEYSLVYRPQSSIMSIQKGYTDTIYGSGSSTFSNVLSIPINVVDPDKCFVLLNINGDVENTRLVTYDLTADILTLTNHSDEYAYVFWQLIEFV